MKNFFKNLFARINPSKPGKKRKKFRPPFEQRFDHKKYGLTPILRMSGVSRKWWNNRYRTEIPKHVPKAERGVTA